MSAPQTNIEKQERRHAVPLWGIIAAVIFAILLVFFIGATMQRDDLQNDVTATDPGAVTTVTE